LILKINVNRRQILFTGIPQFKFAVVKKLILPLAILLLFGLEILRIFFIMPFPGSQYDNTVGLAYFLHNNAWWIRLSLIIVTAWALYRIIKGKKYWRLSFSIFFLLLYSVIFYFLNYRLNADKMFYQPEHKVFAAAENSKVSPGKLIIGIMVNGEAKAYPVEIIGYHHQVQDTVGGKQVMVTYCTVCRTGRIYDPVVDGKKETFRLVGMDHFNAMFEDATTKSWWRQATGEAVTGPKKGEALVEIPSEQMTLLAWLRKYPDSKILQPDPSFLQAYADLVGFDEGTIPSDLEYRDFAPWQFKSWVVGVEYKGAAIAFDWNDVVREKVINDSLPGLPFVVVIESDTVSYHVWNRNVNGRNLSFEYDAANNFLRDQQTRSAWNYDGVCKEGELAGNRLNIVKASQEFLHAWGQFHPGTAYYKR